MSHVDVPRPPEASVRAAWTALHQAERPLAVIGSQAVVQAAQLMRWPMPWRGGIPGLPVGHGAGLLGPAHPLQLRHQRRHALREADCVLLAGVPCDFRLDYGKHVRPARR